MLIGAIAFVAMFLLAGARYAFLGILFFIIGAAFFFMGNAFLSRQEEVLKKGKRYYYKVRPLRGSVKSTYTSPVRSAKIK